MRAFCTPYTHGKTGSGVASTILLLIAAIAGPVAAQPAVEDTEFSVDRGFFDAPFQVAITTDTPGASIRYTTDGSVPTPTAGTVYSGPISISQTTVLRAIAYKSGMTPTNVDTHTYVFLGQVIQQPATIPGWPNNYYWVGGSGYSDAMHDYEMDPVIINDPRWSGQAIAAMKAIPTMSIVMPRSDFWDTYDNGVEHGCSVELIYPNNPAANEQADGGLVPHSHKRLKRSMRLHFKREYDTPKWASQIMRNAPLNDETAVGEYDRIVLRAGNNRSWARIFNDDRIAYTRDEWYRESQVAMSGFGSRGIFVHLYVNGLYWGLYNPVERPEGWFTSEHFGGPKGDWFSVSHGGNHGGDSSRWDYLRNTLVNRNMTNATNYQELQEYLDLPHFSDYLILTWMTGMQDWPQNNWWAGNRNVPPEPLMYFGWDCEWAWDTTSGSNQGAWVDPDFRANDSGGPPIQALFHAARQNQDYMMLFADRVYRACFNDGAVSDPNSRERWAFLNDHIRVAIIGESARWGDAMEINGHPTRTPVDWQNEVDRLDGLMNGNVARLLAALRNEGYYPTVNPPLYRNGGADIELKRLAVPAGFALQLFNPNGTAGSIRYTTDGSDPRLPGGGASGGAGNGGDDTTITINETAVVKSRILNGGEWSALHEAIFFVAEDLSPLKITEIMYHPAPEPVATSETIQRIVGDAGGDDFDRALIEFGAQIPNPDGECLMVTGDGTTNGGVDADIYARLQLLGYNVTLAEDASSLASDANGKSLVFISETIGSANATKFAGVTVPILCSEAFAYDGLNMTPANGQMVVAQDIAIVDSGHPLAAGLSGNVRVTDQTDVLLSLVNTPPSPNAKVIATLAGDPSQAALFWFEAGDVMEGGFVAPARRIGFFFSGTGTSPGDYTAPAWQLFDAAVQWADPPSPPVPPQATPELTAATLSGMAENDIVIISGSTPNSNNGIFEIDHVDVTNVILKDELTSEDPSQAIGDLFLDGDRYEFVELKNTSTNRTLNLSGVTFIRGIDFTFPDGTFLGPGAFAVIAARPWDFATRYPAVPTAGRYFGSLNNGGENVELAFTTGEKFSVTGIVGNDGGLGRITFASVPTGLAAGNRVRITMASNVFNSDLFEIASVAGNTVYVTDTMWNEGAGAKGTFYWSLARTRFGDESPWPVSSDGHGYSLVPTNPNPVGDPANPANWRASANVHGSPGADDPSPPPSTGVQLNEILTNTDPPTVDAVEFHNPTGTTINLDGWWLTDDRRLPRKHRLASTDTIPPGGYLTIYEDDDAIPATPPPTTYFGGEFALDSFGEEVFLFSPTLREAIGLEFEAAQTGISFGRYVTSIGEVHFPAQSRNTFGQANAYPKVEPIVITEIMYHPPAGGHEFIELYNVTGLPAPFFDPVNLENTWKVGGIDFTFPQGIALNPGEVLLLVRDTTTPAAFRAAYGLPATVQVFSYTGGLDNGGETVTLYKPGVPEARGVPYIVVDRVRYDDSGYWPTEPDGAGPSLERIVPTEYGNDPINWKKSDASGGTPGFGNFGVPSSVVDWKRY